MTDKIDQKMVSCWSCPLCPMIYKRRNHFDKHILSAHQLEPSEVTSTWKSEISKQKFDRDSINAINIVKKEKAENNPTPSRSDWGKNAFSTRFSCNFCGEIFKKDFNYVIHLRLEHKSEPREELDAAISDVEHYKLDGCEYQCKICGNKSHQTSSFMRHTMNHGMTFKQYVAVYGNPEISSTQFTCRLCARSMKRTRNIVTVHMKMVHGVSWQEYRSKTQPGLNSYSADNAGVVIEDNVELFKCVLCEKKVKGKKQHLTRIHKIDQEVYESYVNKLNSGEKVPLLENCKMCGRRCLELEKHVKLCHRIEMDEYYIQEMETEQDTSFEVKDPDSLSCSFNCGEVFDKENELIIHINLVHANEDEDEKLRVKSKIMSDLKAKTLSSKIICKACDCPYSSRSSLWVHVTRKHGLTWKAYEAKFGSVEKDICKLEPFKCLICDEKVKNEKQKILRHIKSHDISHSEYVKEYVKNNNFNFVKQEEESDSEEEESKRNQFLKESCKYKLPSLSTPPSVAKLPLSSSMNVTDRNVKSCSRCSIDFPSRLRFIRHCHLVHKMKFKLRNGDKLVLP